MLQLVHWLPARNTVEKVVSVQRVDAKLELLLEFLRTEAEPTKYFLMLPSAETKAYWLNKEKFILKDGVLFYRHVSDDPFEPEIYKLVVPESLRKIYLNWPMIVIIIIIIVGFIERKIDTNPLMRLSPRRNSPGTDMGQHPKGARQGITKVGGMPA